jgi:hypothetical protein
VFVVFISRNDSKDDVPPVIVRVVIVGDVSKTLFPVPVFVTLIRFLEASVATALDAVKPLNLTAPLLNNCSPNVLR